MMYTLCSRCTILGYCREQTVEIVFHDELNDPEFVRDLRRTAYEFGVPYRQWHDFVVETYLHYPGRVIDEIGMPIYLNTEVFEIPHIEHWFRGFCCTPCPPQTRPRVHNEARERVVVLGTVLKMIDPVAAALWGVRAANDNRA